jgi:hypothetical protein
VRIIELVGIENSRHNLTAWLLATLPCSQHCLTQCAGNILLIDKMKPAVQGSKCWRHVVGHQDVASRAGLNVLATSVGQPCRAQREGDMSAGVLVLPCVASPVCLTVRVTCHQLCASNMRATVASCVRLTVRVTCHRQCRFYRVGDVYRSI